MGPSQNRSSLLSSALAPLWSTQIIVFDAHFLDCLAEVKKPPPLQQMEDVNYLSTKST